MPTDPVEEPASDPVNELASDPLGELAHPTPRGPVDEPADGPADGPVFDPVVHAPQRLQICALLARAGETEFGVLREALDVSDATLSKHLRTLTDHDYVRTRRVQRLRGQARTWVSLTSGGRRALSAHFAFLYSLAPAAPDAPGAGSGAPA